MKITEIKDFFNGINRPIPVPSISLDDCPSANHFAQTIEEEMNAIIFSMKEFKGYIKEADLNNLMKSIWARKVSDKETILQEFLCLKLSNQNVSWGESIKTMNDIKNEKKIPEDEAGKAEVDKLKGKLEYFEKGIERAFQTINETWSIIQSVDGVEFKESFNPTIKQIYDWTALLPQHRFLKPSEDGNTPHWDKLCDKIDSCCKKTNKCCCWSLLLPVLAIIVFAVFGCLVLSDRVQILDIDISQNAKWIHYIFIFSCFAAILVALILLSYKFFQFQSKQCENKARLKEKMMNAVIDAFNDDREFSRLQTKTDIALHEKLERARIEEWSRNKEHERRLNVMEQERIAELDKLLLEMAKVKNTVTLSDPKGHGKTIVIERSILSDDCCNELKDIVGKYISKEDDCCKLLKEIFQCLMDGIPNQERCKRIKELLKCLLCHDSDCDKKYKDLCDKIDQIMLIINNNNVAVNPNGMPVVNNINFTKGE